MADVLTDLVRALGNSKTRLNEQETKAFRACVYNSLRDGAIGASVAGGVAWIASRRLSRFFRNSLVGGAGFMCGMWCIDRSFHSSFDRILSMEGKMKNELARIMAQRYRNDPKKMKLLAKHFYSEEVFDDSTPGRPKLMFRQRNAYIDNAAQISRSSGNYGHDYSVEKKNAIADSSKQRENDDAEKVRKAVPEWRQANGTRKSFENVCPPEKEVDTSGVSEKISQKDGLFDSLFDHSDVSSGEVARPSNSPSTQTKPQTRRERRMQRRSRLHRRRHSDSSTMDNV